MACKENKMERGDAEQSFEVEEVWGWRPGSVGSAANGSLALRDTGEDTGCREEG